MCGFISVFSKTCRKFPAEHLSKMTNMLSHRGPDDEGFFYHENWLSLGFRRLSILDLSKKGHQPMKSADGRFVIVFNGEIYNYKELRDELEKRNYNFYSNTDTEVILSAYQEWGKNCIEQFSGMFAFVITDLVEHSAFIVRDPLGIKPLFVFEDNQYLFVTSEIKALLPYCSFQPDFSTIHEYLIFRSIVGKKTLFKNVNNLQPGFYLEYKNNHLSETKYFDIASTFQENYSRRFDEVVELTENKLKESVKIHLRSDVELGIQLSGGVDSSLITALASNELNKKIHSFSISFDDTKFDESKYQKYVSEKYHTVHHDYRMTNELLTDFFPKTTWFYEYPLYSPNCIATYYLTLKAKKYITVMLSGEGADESFLGYNRYSETSINRLSDELKFYRYRKLLKTLSHFWPFQKGKSILRNSQYHPVLYSFTFADLKMIDSLLNGKNGQIQDRYELNKTANGNLLHQLMLQDQISYLSPWLQRADRLGMANSMELRVPFCTAEMFTHANSIPYEYRVYNGERKAILKKIAEKYLDNELIYRKKIGFGVPVNIWNNNGLYGEFIRDLIESIKSKNREFINYQHFDMIYSKYITGHYSEHLPGFLWTYANLELWYQIFFEGTWREINN